MSRQASDSRSVSASVTAELVAATRPRTASRALPSADLLVRVGELPRSDGLNAEVRDWIEKVKHGAGGGIGCGTEVFRCGSGGSALVGLFRMAFSQKAAPSSARCATYAQ